MSPQLNKTLIGLILCCSVGTTKALTYEVPTHELFNRRAALQSEVLDGYLTKRLGLPSGVETKLLSKTIIDIIAEAGAREDDGWRFLNHFHNPLKPWPVAGLATAVPLIHGQSSLLWAQRAAGDPQQGWSWHDGRDYFYQALTAKEKTARDQALANTFRAVGQVMHLIEDASVPAHVRNDAHPPVISGYHYETWAKAHQDELNTSPLRPSIDLTNAFLDEEFVPIYKLFDTDQYTGDNPAVTDSLSIGIAEYTNAHFFSDDTMFAEDFAPEDPHYFRHPSKASVDPIPWVDPLDDEQYLAEAREGGIQHVVLVSWLYRYRLVYFPEITKFLPVTIKDDLVFQEQAQHLVPRAVGYAAEALDYFFRGQIDLIKDPAKDGYFLVKNLSAEPMSGTFGLYYDDSEGERRVITSWPLTIAPGGSSSSVTFTAPTDHTPEPTDTYYLVFRGIMGGEATAVVVAQVTVSTDPPLFARVQLPTGPVYWDITKDEETRLSGVIKVSEAVRANPGSYVTGNFDISCPDPYPGRVECRAVTAFGDPENIYLPEISAPFGKREFMASGYWVHDDENDRFELTVDDNWSGYLIGFLPVNRGDARAYVGINRTRTIHYHYLTDFYARIFTTVADWTNEFKFGVYLTVGGVLAERIESPLGISTGTGPYHYQGIASDDIGNRFPYSGSVFIMGGGAITRSTFHPTRDWVLSFYYEYEIAGTPSNVPVRVDSFQYDGFGFHHLEGKPLPNLEAFLVSRTFFLIPGLVDLVTGVVLP